jgi:osmoprotectant transport system permease protein
VVGGSVLVVLLAVIVQLAFIGVRRAVVSQGLRGSSRTS